MRLTPLWIATLALSAGCARGTSANLNDGVGGADESSSTSSASQATASSTSSSNTASSSGSAASSTSSGGMCSEQPCKLVSPQCGCAAGEACTIDPTSKSRSCAPAGGTGWQEACGAGSDCTAGYLCVQDSKTVSTCAKYCSTDSDCKAPGGLCVITLNDGNGGSIPDVTMCSDDCSPATNVGCPAAGTSCQPAQEAMGAMRMFSRCGGSGPGSQGSSCTTGADCAATFGCFNTSPNQAVCLKWCNVAAPNCPAGKSCVMVTINGNPIAIGGTTYGACN